MAINDSRSLTQDLLLGAGDGSYKDLAPDRGGEIESAPLLHRQSELSPSFYGLNPGIVVDKTSPTEPFVR